MALENCPVNARGLMSGILQQGYSIGYVLAACANLGVGGSTNSWKKVFWAGAGVSIGVGFIRMLFPESKQFIEAKKAGHKAKAPGLFWAETKKMLRQEWRMCIYCIILMTWVSYLPLPFQPPPSLFPVLIIHSSTTTPTPAKTATQPSCSPKNTSPTPPQPAPPSS